MFPPLPLRTLLIFVSAFLISGFALAQDPLGVIAQLKGEARRVNASGVHPLSIDDTFASGDAIETGSGARLLLRLSDGSTVTLSQNAHLIIETPASSVQPSTQRSTTPAYVFDFFRGVFRFISGKVAKQNPDAVTIRTPVATIGIRGTDFVGGELQVGMPAGRPHYGFQIREGSIAVIAAGGTVLLERPGEGTFLPLTKIAAPTPVRQWTIEEAAEADAALQF